MVTPYFCFTAVAGKLSKVHMPSSASADELAPASRAAKRIFKRMVRVSFGGGGGFAFGGAASVLGEDFDQLINDGGEIRHLPPQLADEAVGIHVLSPLARQGDESVFLPAALLQTLGRRGEAG